MQWVDSMSVMNPGSDIEPYQAFACVDCGAASSVLISVEKVDPSKLKYFIREWAVRIPQMPLAARPENLTPRASELKRSKLNTFNLCDVACQCETQPCRVAGWVLCLQCGEAKPRLCISGQPFPKRIISRTLDIIRNIMAIRLIKPKSKPNTKPRLCRVKKCRDAGLKYRICGGSEVLTSVNNPKKKKSQKVLLDYMLFTIIL